MSMISKADIIKMAKHVMRRGSGLPDRRLMHPYREWYIGVAGALVLVVVGATFSFLQFRHYDTLEDRLDVEKPTPIEYRAADAELILERFAEQRTVFERLRNQFSVGAPLSPAPDTVPSSSGSIEFAP